MKKEIQLLYLTTFNFWGKIFSDSSFTFWAMEIKEKNTFEIFGPLKNQRRQKHKRNVVLVVKWQ